MNEQQGDSPELSAALSALTDPGTGETAHWRSALERSRAPANSALKRLSFKPWMGASIAASIVVVIAATIAFPGLDGARQGRFAEASPATRSTYQGMSGFADQDSANSVLLPHREETADRTRAWISDGAEFVSMDPTVGLAASVLTSPQKITGLGRAVARDASMALIVEDLRSAFEAATRLARSLDGEFVENSAVNGREENARATVRLRVASDRLDHVMAEARALGEVAAEQLDARDVTDALVDLEARIRNEKRVEAELLDLLATRSDAPLADILKVRDALSQVRLRIEQLQAQQASLQQRVSLSTLTITLSVKAEEPKDEPEPGYLASQLSDAWRSAGRMLADSIAWFVRVGLGGAVFWLVAAIVGLAVWRRLHRRAAWAS